MLILYHSKEAAFLGDSNFPFYGIDHKTIGDQLYLFTRLWEKYSTLFFSHPTDKPVALSGLEQRLTKKFAENSGAGVFKQRWGRFLLWSRAKHVPSLTRINFMPQAESQSTSAPAPKAGTERTPSWSLLAYVGAIAFVQPAFGSVTWESSTENGLRLTGTSTKSWLYCTEALSFEAEARDFDTVANIETIESDLVYDVPEEANTRITKCVIIGEQKNATDPGAARHYVLIISPKEPRSTGVYERIGAGYMPGRFIEGRNAWAERMKIE